MKYETNFTELANLFNLIAKCEAKAIEMKKTDEEYHTDEYSKYLEKQEYIVPLEIIDAHCKLDDKMMRLRREFRRTVKEACDIMGITKQDYEGRHILEDSEYKYCDWKKMYGVIESLRYRSVELTTYVKVNID